MKNKNITALEISCIKELQESHRSNLNEIGKEQLEQLSNTSAGEQKQNSAPTAGGETENH
jgi:hypothetical protein